MNIFTIDTQLKHRPFQIQFCKKCVVSNQRPRITFDADGICSACRFAEKKQQMIDWSKREKELQKLLARFRSKNGLYDCIVPSSGGKDSGYVAYELKHTYGMHPLTVTWAPFIYTDIGWRNYIAFKDSGFDNVLFFPNGQLHRKLAKITFYTKGDAWEPFAYGQKAYAFHMALKFHIPLIFYGENGEAEYGGSIKNAGNAYETVSDWDKLYFKGSGIDGIIKYGQQMKMLHSDDVKNNAFDLYRPPKLELIDKMGVQMHWLSYYKKWIPQENYYCAAEHTGFRANPIRSEGTYSKYASLDDKLDGFHYYMAYIKFGIGRTTSDAAHEIRDGHITREEGVALVKRYDGEFPARYFEDFLTYLDIDESTFWKVVNFYRILSPHLWKRNKKNWILAHSVFNP